MSTVTIDAEIDLNDIEDDDLLDELECRISDRDKIRRAGRVEILDDAFDDRLKEIIEGYINGIDVKPPARESMIDTMKRQLINAACEKYTLAELERRLM